MAAFRKASSIRKDAHASTACPKVIASSAGRDSMPATLQGATSEPDLRDPARRYDRAHRPSEWLPRLGADLESRAERLAARKETRSACAFSGRSDLHPG